MAPPIVTERRAMPWLAPLLADLAEHPLPQDPHAVEALRDAARTAIAHLPANHPLAAADVGTVGCALLVRLLVRVAPDLEPTVPRRRS